MHLDDIRQLVAERVYIQAGAALKRAEFDLAASRGTVEVLVDQRLQQIVLMFDTYVHGMSEETLRIHQRWPRTWWDAFKARWFPLWWLLRWPAKYDSIDVEQKIFKAVCPHIGVDDPGKHMKWMHVQPS